jgi:hypothetical protein
MNPSLIYRENFDTQRPNELVTRVYAQHLYASFLLEALKPLVKTVKGFPERRDFDDWEGRSEKLLLHSVFTNMAKDFVQCGLGTEEEAYVCIIPILLEKLQFKE